MNNPSQSHEDAQKIINDLIIYNPATPQYKAAILLRAMLAEKHDGCALVEKISGLEKIIKELKGRADNSPDITLIANTFKGANADGSSPFEFEFDGLVNRIKSIRMEGWFCFGPKQPENRKKPGDGDGLVDWNRSVLSTPASVQPVAWAVYSETGELRGVFTEPQDKDAHSYYRNKVVPLCAVI